MNNLIPVVLASVLFLAGVYSVIRIYSGLTSVEKSKDAEVEKSVHYEAEITSLSAELELARAKAHTHSVVAGIEDSTAIAIDVSMGLEAELTRMQTLIKKLHKIREGPYAYDKNTPSGRRPSSYRLRL
jgi:hypothetical protein